MNVIICPGIHAPELTDSFVTSLAIEEHNLLVFPTTQYPAYSSWHVYHWLQQQQLVSQDLLFITFSAGVVGGAGAAIALQLAGYRIAALIAIDGWGVPLLPIFPLYRLSHDYFTHWSSAILGGSNESFYAEPSSSHLDIWRFPEACQGWGVIRKTRRRAVHQTMRCKRPCYPKDLSQETRPKRRGQGDKVDERSQTLLLRCSAKDYLKLLLDKYVKS